MSLYVRELEPRPLKEWWREEEGIDFAPVYQRKASIWSLAAKQRLIDTVLNGFDIPKVYLADFTRSERSLDNAGLPFAVIDGKQRLQTLFSFFSGKLRLAPSFVLFDDPELELGGYNYNRLVMEYPHIANRFAKFQLTVMGVITDDERNINELFLRLNASSPLTGAEKRNAMLGVVPELIRRIVTHIFFTKKISFSTARGQDFNTAAKLLLLEHAGGPFDTKKTQLDRLVSNPAFFTEQARRARGRDRVDLAIGSFVDAIQETENPDVAHSADRVMAALDRIGNLFKDHDPLLSAQAQLPLIYLLASKIDDRELVKLRPFLVEFAKDRTKNKAFAIDSPQKDQELSHFELLNRSSNDQGSIDQRYKILLRRFKRFS